MKLVLFLYCDFTCKNRKWSQFKSLFSRINFSIRAHPFKFEKKNIVHLQRIPSTSVLRPGPTRRVDPGPGRPGSVAGPGLREKQVGNWPGQTWSTRDPAGPAETQVYFFYILMPETTSFWPFTIKRPKRQEQRDECIAECRATKVRRRPN